VEVRASFDLADWAVELAQLRWGEALPAVDVHLNLPLHDVSGSGPSNRLSFANALLQARGSGRGLPTSSTVLLGDLTLNGDVLPVGCVAEKVRAARAAGITCVVAPSGSAEPDVREVGTLDDLVRLAA
jgi:ATP-dependent Lon protease